MNFTKEHAFDLAERFTSIEEVGGWMLKLPLPFERIIFSSHGNSLFSTPSSANAPTQCCVFNADFISPLRHSLRSSKRGYQMIGSSIVALFFSSSPNYIAGFVVTRIINPIKLQAIRFLADISKKAHKVVPSFRDFYTSSAIILVVIGIWIVASLAHRFPRCVSSGISLPMNGGKVSAVGGVVSLPFSACRMFFSHVISPYRYAVRGQQGVVAPAGPVILTSMGVA